MSEQISLFNDGAFRVEAKFDELTLVAPRGRPLTKAQQTFNRLIKRISRKVASVRARALRNSVWRCSRE
ncbi:MAG TPA: hypothetical protein VFY96_14700 [Candidatus Binatia bacterium]|nr:hypothetical protein [Candidatus Binatia bacterium]